MICECGRVQESARALGCNECRRIQAEHEAAERKERQGNVRETVSRLLARHYPDWVDGAEVCSVVGARGSSTLWDLHEDGEIEKRWEKGFGMVYRLKQRRAA